MKKILILLILLVGCNSQEDLSEEQKAILLAKQEIISAKGEDEFEAQKPYVAVKEGDDWIVTGSGNCPRGHRCEGGKHTVVIQAGTGSIKDFYTSEQIKERVMGARGDSI